MRVIKRGQDPRKVKYVYTCTRCESVLEIEVSDVKPDQREGDYVVCAVCSCYIRWDLIQLKGETVHYD